jgi:hypothetical protein
MLRHWAYIATLAPSRLRVEGGGNEARHMTHRTLGSLDKQVDQLLLLFGINGEDVDKGNEFPLLRDFHQNGVGSGSVLSIVN